MMSHLKDDVRPLICPQLTRSRRSTGIARAIDMRACSRRSALVTAVLPFLAFAAAIATVTMLIVARLG